MEPDPLIPPTPDPAKPGIPNPLFDPNAPRELVGPGPVPTSKPRVPAFDPIQATQSVLSGLLGDQAKEDKKLLTPDYQKAQLVKPQTMENAEAMEASRYTDQGETYLRGRNNEATAASHQGFWSAAWNDTKAFGAIMSSSILQAPLAIPQAIKALTSAIKGEGASQAINTLRGEEGSWMNDLTRWQDKVGEDAQNFQSDWGRENPWKNLIPVYGGEGGSDFGSLVRSGGFIIGGIATSLAETAVGGLLAAETGGATLALPVAGITSRLAKAFKGLSTIGKSLDKIADAAQLEKQAEGAYRGVNTLSSLGKLWNGVDTSLGNFSTRSVIHSFLLANGEASLEGFSAEKETEAKLLADYKNQYGTDPDSATQARIKQTAQQAGNSAFLLNHALLRITNRFQIDSILKNYSGANGLFSDELFNLKRKAGTGLFEAVEKKVAPVTFGQNDTWYLKGLGQVATGARKVGVQGALSVSEGFEESLQKAVQDGTQSYYQYQFNHGGEGDLRQVLKSAGEGLEQAFGTQEGWTEFIGGMVIGGLFGGGSKAITDYMNKPGIKAQFEKYAAQMNLSVPALQSLVQQQINQSVLGQSLTNKAAQANGQLTASAVGAQAAGAGDQLIFQNQKNTGQFAFLNPFVQQGAGDVLREQLGTFKEDIEQNPAEFAKSFGLDENTPKPQLLDSVAKLEEQLGYLENRNTQFNTLYRNPFKQKENPEEHEDWNYYKGELLHNDFLRNEYGKRIASLDAQTSILVADNPYVTETSWKAHKAELESSLKQMDQVLETAKQDVRDSAGPSSPGEDTDLDAEVAKVEQQILASQQKERDRTARRLSVVKGLIDNKFSDYDELIKGVREELTDADGTARLPKSTTNEEIKRLLQASFDSHSLKESVDKLADGFNGLTSRKGFETWQKDKNLYKARQLAKQLKEAQKDQEALKVHVLSQFDSPQDAAFHLGNVDQYTLENLDPYLADKTTTKDKVTQEIQQIKQTRQEEKKARQKQQDDLKSLLNSDVQVRSIQARKDGDIDGKKLDQLIANHVASNTGQDPLEASLDILQKYSEAFPTPVKQTPPQPNQSVENDLDGLEPYIEDQYDDLADLEPYQEEAVSQLTDDLEVLEPFIEEQPVVKPKVDPVRVATQKGIQSFEYRNLSPEEKKLVETVPLGDDRLAVVFDTLGRKVRGLGSLFNKYFSTGMVILDNQPKWFSPKELEENPAYREKWYEIVQARKTLLEDLKDGGKLSELVDWKILDEIKPAFENLRDDYGLARSSVSRYLVATPKKSEEPVLIIPLEESLRVRESVVLLLREQDWIPASDKQALANLDGSTPLLIDVLRIIGEDGYKWLQKTRLVNSLDTYQELIRTSESYNQAVAGIQEINPGTLARLDQLTLTYSASGLFLNKENLFSIEDLAFNTVDGENQLIVRKTTDSNGVVSYKYVENKGREQATLSEQDYNSVYQEKIPKAFQNRKNLDGYYLIVSGGQKALFPVPIKMESGTEKLMNLISRKAPFNSSTEGFYVQNQGQYELELDGSNLDKGKLVMRLQMPQAESDPITYYSPAIRVSNLTKNGINEALTKATQNFKTSEGTPAGVDVGPIQLFQGGKNIYDRAAFIQGAAVFTRMDMNWSLAPRNQQADEVVIEAPVMPQAQATTTPIQTPAPTMNQTYPQLEEFARAGFLEPVLQVLQNRMISKGVLPDVSKLDNPVFVTKFSQADATDTKLMDTLVRVLTTVTKGSVPGAVTTRLQENSKTLDQVVRDLLDRCH